MTLPPTHAHRPVITRHPLRRGHLALPHRQRGVALIIALILVALATVLATKLMFDGWLEQRRTMGVLAAEQALQFSTGAEALAADVLIQVQQSNPPTINLAQAWAQDTQPLPLTPESNAEGEPIGTLQAKLEDMQGRFNLNNLAGVLQDGVTPDPEPFEQFTRLLELVGVEPKWAGLARDWIDANDTPGTPDGAEDAVYTSQTPPYKTGNWPMTSPTELLNLPGFGAERYHKIAPYVTALPLLSVTHTPINICTAPAKVLQSLAVNLSGEYNDEMLAEGRKAGCFPDEQTFKNTLGSAANNTKTLQYIAVKSSYFRLTTRVVLGTNEFTLYSLLAIGNNNKVTPLLRTFGTL